MKVHVPPQPSPGGASAERRRFLTWCAAVLGALAATGLLPRRGRPGGDDAPGLRPARFWRRVG